MGRVRPFAPDDIPAIVALRRKSFPHSRHPDAAGLAAYLEQVLLRNPWRDESLPSLVYLDAAGRPAGFIGVVPRRAVFRGEDVRVAVSTQLMVEAAERGLAGVQLIQAFLAGPQDLSFADLATDASRRIWEGLGGRVSLLQSFRWRVPLVPFAGRRVAGAASRAAVRLARKARRALGGDGQDAALAAEPLQPETLAEAAAPLLGDVSLRPVYTPWTARWLLSHLATKTDLGEPRGTVLRSAGGAVVGWYLYYRTRGVGEVVQIAAHRNGYDATVAHLIEDARDAGVAAVAGRVEGALVPALRRRSVRIERAAPWVLVHSRRRDLLTAVLSGDAFLSRLEGEWWMSF